MSCIDIFLKDRVDGGGEVKEVLERLKRLEVGKWQEELVNKLEVMTKMRKDEGMWEMEEEQWLKVHSACGMLLDDTPLFDPSLLHELDWSSVSIPFSPAVSPAQPGNGLVLRPLCTADLDRGYYKLLSQLTLAGDVTEEQFKAKFEHMKKSGDYYVIVVEDTSLGQIVATGTLIIEHKFIHACAKRGRVEEVVVSDVCRGKQLGKLLVSTLTLLSKTLQCYKVTLECAPKNVEFYKKFGYSASDETYMQCRFCD
ncbi:hypothetical protein DNTS_021287 [Danionella cerebrum]|uniref:Glucosamine 6-phosphate N-acetyltransferase n=1 Tax=Danionella cerebrum TaxID=2873325 RepID=A0A553MMB2_9TELE|nr:hypothetical protein DNTS_021287 [Danionella translucida]